MPQLSTAVDQSVGQHTVRSQVSSQTNAKIDYVHEP
jgi:hypothetical protein